MTGAASPSDRSLLQHIANRMLSLVVQSGIDRRFQVNRLGIHNVGDVQLEKRFNQIGVLNPCPMVMGDKRTSADSLGHS